MSDENITTSAEGIGLPAVLGGEAVRPAGSFRTTPERDQLEVRYLSEWVLGASNWEPDAPNGGVALRGVEVDPAIAEALGWEPAAFAAEFLRLQAPHQHGLTAVPNNNGTRIITAVFAALTQWAEEYDLRVPRVGDEVIVPVATWQATAGALLSRNLVPVLVDVDPETLTIGVDAVANAITDRTVGIVPVHLYGRMADVPALLELAAERGLFVLEDCAHAHGARFGDGAGAGTLGHAGTFSMQGSKVLASGEGGALVSRLAEAGAAGRLDRHRAGRQLPGTKVLQADNDRMPAVVAALLRAQLTRFPEQNAKRVRNFAALDAIAANLPGVTPLAPSGRRGAADLQAAVPLRPGRVRRHVARAAGEGLRGRAGLRVRDDLRAAERLAAVHAAQRQRQPHRRRLLGADRPSRYEAPVAARGVPERARDRARGRTGRRVPAGVRARGAQAPGRTASGSPA